MLLLLLIVVVDDADDDAIAFVVVIIPLLSIIVVDLLTVLLLAFYVAMSRILTVFACFFVFLFWVHMGLVVGRPFVSCDFYHKLQLLLSITATQ